MIVGQAWEGNRPKRGAFSFCPGHGVGFKGGTLNCPGSPANPGRFIETARTRRDPFVLVTSVARTKCVGAANETCNRLRVLDTRNLEAAPDGDG